MDRKQWNRIGIATAAALLVPGGFLLGAAMLARRRKNVADEGDVTATDARQEAS